MTMKRVFVPITNEEKLVFCDKLVECYERRDLLMEDFKEEKSRHKDEIKKIEFQADELRKILGRGTEEREIDVDEIAIEESYEIELRRGGTGELVFRRPMTIDEISKLRTPGLPFAASPIHPQEPPEDPLPPLPELPDEDDEEDEEEDEEEDVDDENMIEKKDDFFSKEIVPVGPEKVNIDEQRIRYPIKRRPKTSNPVVKRHRRKTNSQEIHA
jgi:hypothetical protein